MTTILAEEDSLKRTAGRDSMRLAGLRGNALTCGDHHTKGTSRVSCTRTRLRDPCHMTRSGPAKTRWTELRTPESAEFPFDGARHLMFGGSMLGQKRFQLRSHDAVEDRLFRRSDFVQRSGSRHAAAIASRPPLSFVRYLKLIAQTQKDPIPNVNAAVFTNRRSADG
jgi:hypothetical protein